MKFIVIGGGITGVISAILARKHGHEVEIYEMKANLGGILCDTKAADDWFFNNTQYINVDSLCYEILSKEVGIQFSTFEHDYGAITDFDDKSVFSNTFAQPCFLGNAPKIDVTTLPNNIKSRLALYGNDGVFLQQFASRFGDIEQLHINNLLPIQVARVFYPNDIDNVVTQKRQNPIANELMGLPREHLGISKQLAALPNGGYDKLIDDIKVYLKNAGISYNCNATVIPKVVDLDSAQSAITLQSKGETLSFDYAVWCANPTSLLHRAMGKNLNTPSLKTYCAVGHCLQVKNLQPIYIQVFSLKTSIVRFFLYNDKGNTKITVEGLGHGFSEAIVSSEVDKFITEHFQTKISSKLTFYKQRRFNILSSTDFCHLEEYSKSWQDFKIIPGGWHLYGRDAKIESIKTDIEKTR